VQKRLRLLGAGDNTRHGKGIDHAEIHDAILFVGANSGYDSTQVAAILNTTSVTVDKVFNEKKAIDHFKKLGIDVPVGHMGLSQLRILGAHSAKIHDEPFASLTRLAHASKMPPPELRELVKKVETQPSDAAAMAMLKSEWTARQEAMDMMATKGGKGGKSLPSQARERFEFVLGHDVNELVETNPVFATEHLDQLQRMISLLQEVVDLQERRNPPPSPRPSLGNSIEARI
jgi:hypothetical protein